MVASILLMISLVAFYEEGKILHIVLVIISSCMLVLAYPTTVIIVIPVFIIVSKREKKYGICYLLGCFFAGVIYLLILAASNGIMVLIDNITCVFGGDSTHGMKRLVDFWDTSLDYPYMINVIFIILIVIGLAGKNLLNDMEKHLWMIGIIISLIDFVAVVLLTNLGLSSSLGYLVLGASVSVIPISKVLRRGEMLPLIIVCLVLIFSRGLWVINGYTAIKGRFITNVENVVRKGPTIGIMAPLNIVNEARESAEDWEENVCGDDSVLAVGDWIIDSIVYLYTNAEVANYSTIDTTTYSDKLAEYWKKYPEKYPSVIAIKAYEGEINQIGSEYISTLVKDEYELSAEGKQWIFFRAKN